MGNGCSQSLAKQELLANRSKQMADSEKMKEIDFSHCAGKYSSFQMQSSYMGSKDEKKRKKIRVVNYKDNISDSRSLQSQKNILRKHHYIFDLFFFSSSKYLLLPAW